jgi:NAD-reducing hydrogenase large subunit
MASKERKIVINPVTRIEGHAKVTIRLNDRGKVDTARMHIVEFRGFERFVQGRLYWEAPVIVQRLCGICPVSHLLCASKAMDMVAGVDKLTPTAEKMRRLLHFGQTYQSHALHFFHLSAPDLLLGYDADPAIRNVIGLVKEHTELAIQAVKMRKYGQEVIKATAGKKIHGTGSIPGGFNKNLSTEERDYLLKDVDQMIQWAADGVNLYKELYMKDIDRLGPLGSYESNHVSIVREEKGWYRVGPLARVNNCDFIDSPLAEKERQEFMELGKGKPVQSVMAYHWARLIETLYSAEKIKELLNDPDLQKDDLLKTGKRRPEGIAILEAPRGTLFHHYRVDDNDQITMANLIVSTTSNNQPMNESVRVVAEQYLQGGEITEPLLNLVEVAIRAYDPCLSCATHAVGQMPLQVTLRDADGKVLDERARF